MRNLRIVITALILVLFSLGAHAIPITGSYAVTANIADPGLKISTENLAPDQFSYDLAVGESTTFGLFEIWTNEGSVSSGGGLLGLFSTGDDEIAKPIAVDFSLLLAGVPGLVAGRVEGTTVGQRAWFGLSQEGAVNWNGALDVYFGAVGDGHFRIELSDEKFSQGFAGLWNSRATVEATVTLLSGATVVAIPAPGGLVLLGLGLLVVAVVAIRRRSVAPRA